MSNPSNEESLRSRTPGARGPVCVRGVVLIADSSAERRDVLGKLLRAEGFTTLDCASGSDVVPLAKQHQPDVCFVDVGMKRLDAGECIRILERFEGTRSVVVVLTCPAEIDAGQLARLEASGALLVLVRPLTRAGLLQAFRQALEESHTRKAKFDAVDVKRKPVGTRHVEGNSSLLVRRLECPFHETPVAVDHYVLRTGKIQTDTNFFDLPVYKSAVAGADYVDYHLLGVAVCPRCLFASNNPEYFSDPANRKAKPHEHPAAAKRAIAATAGARLQQAGKMPPDFFTERRTLAGAILSYQLAIASGTSLLECDRQGLSFELLRLGNYHLRLAHLEGVAKTDHVVLKTHYDAASKFLREAFAVLAGAPMYKATYQVVALALASGEDAVAYQYLTRLSELERQPIDLTPDRTSLDRYLARCRAAWEDRAEHRFAWVSGSSDVAAAA